MGGRAHEALFLFTILQNQGRVNEPAPVPVPDPSIVPLGTGCGRTGELVFTLLALWPKQDDVVVPTTVSPIPNASVNDTLKYTTKAPDGRVSFLASTLIPPSEMYA